MHRRLTGLALACALSFFPGVAQQAAAQVSQSSQAQSLEQELEDLDGQIAEADRLLGQVEAGGYLFLIGFGLAVLTREQLVQWATDQIISEGAGQDAAAIGVVVGQERAIRIVQDIVARNPQRIAALRQARQDDVNRRAVVQRQLAGLRNPGGDRVAAATSRGCGFPHSWQVRMSSGGAILAVDASGSISGSGLRGTATLAGNRLTLQWTTRASGGNWAGRFIVTLDGACNGAGELVLDTRPDGAEEFGLNGGPVTFTSRVRAGPS